MAASQSHAAVARWLHRIAMGLTVIPLIFGILLLIAGTFQVANPARPGSYLIGLSDLSLVSFKGLVVNNSTEPDAPSFLVTVQLFASAFTWSWPDAPETPEYWKYGAAPLTTSNFLSRGPRSELDPFDLLSHVPGTTGGLVDIPNEEYRCLHNGYSSWSFNSDDLACTNPFWAMVQRSRAFSFTFPVAWLNFVVYVAACLVVVATLVTEWVIWKHPWAMRCQCWGFFKKMCPLPKGPREEVENLHEHTWDTVRLWYYAVLVLYWLLPAGHDTIMSGLFVSSLRRMENNRLPRGMSMDAQQGTTYLGLAWANVIISSLACLCMVVKWQLTKRTMAPTGQQQEGLCDDGCAVEAGSLKSDLKDTATVSDMETGTTPLPKS